MDESSHLSGDYHHRVEESDTLNSDCDFGPLQGMDVDHIPNPHHGNPITQEIPTQVSISEDNPALNPTSESPHGDEPQSIGEEMDIEKSPDQFLEPASTRLQIMSNNSPVLGEIYERRKRRPKQLEDMLELTKQELHTQKQLYNDLNQKFDELQRKADNHAQIYEDLMKEKNVQVQKCNELERKGDEDARRYEELERACEAERWRHDDEIRDKDDEINLRQLDIDEFNRKYSQLNQNYQDLVTKSRQRNTYSRVATLEAQSTELISKSKTLEYECGRLRDKSESLDKDNTKLRAQIARMCSAQDSIHVEEYYIQQFNQLNSEVESWVATETKKKPATPSSDTFQDHLTEVLKLLGRDERSTSTLMSVFLRDYEKSRPKRIALIRHAVARILFKEVLALFAFGLSRDSSKFLKYIEKEIYNQGIDLATMVTVRQSIGRATLKSLKPEELEICKETVIDNICVLLTDLLPASGNDKIKDFATKIVDNAISLRNAMTAEQAIYRCYFQYTGDCFQDSIAQIANGEEKTGNILICVFPGLRRFTIRTDGKREFVTVVSARVKLEGVFG